jgi:hypothetical protein
MKFLMPFFILTITLQSCGNQTQKETTQSNSEDSGQSTAFSGEIKSLLRPNDKPEPGKIYTDTVAYVDFNDDGDYWWFYVRKGKDTIALAYNDSPNFIKGEELEIRWKMDSIWVAGDGDRLDFSEWLVSAKRLKPLKLTNKKVKFLWREMQYVEDLDGEFNVITLNEKYIKNISEPEKAVLAYVATFIGNECSWDGKANENRSNLKCKILSGLDLGYQCSSRHLDFLRFWFRNNKNILKELENCPTTPDGATVQDTFDEIDLEIKDNKITVFFKASGINVREQQSWKWTENHFFEFKDDELILLKKDISSKEYGQFEVREN